MTIAPGPKNMDDFEEEGRRHADATHYQNTHDDLCERIFVDIGVGEMKSPCGCMERWYECEVNGLHEAIDRLEATRSETAFPDFDSWWAAQGKTTFSFSEQSSYRSWCSLAWKAARATPSAIATKNAAPPVDRVNQGAVRGPDEPAVAAPDDKNGDWKTVAYSIDNLVAVLLYDGRIDSAQARLLTKTARHLEATASATGMPELIAAARSAESLLRNGGTFPVCGITWQALHDALKLLDQPRYVHGESK